MKTVELNSFDLTRNICLTIKVTGTDELKLRIKIGAALMRLAGRVMGCDVKVEFK